MGNTFCGNGSASNPNVAASPPPTKGEKDPNLVAGRFRIHHDKIVGRGSFATVKLGSDLKTKKKVAIRVMPTGAICAVSLKHLQREVAIHPTLDHPSIIKCYFCAEEEQAIVMVQEYVPDGSLLDYYAKRRVLLEFEVRSLTQQLVSAIAYLHGKGIVHRDIKADNILIFADTQIIKLADFGFADTIKPDQPYFTNFPGTLAYSPPEVLMGRPHLGPPRDMWSLGVLVYILLTGRYPFGSQATQKTKMRVLNDEPDYVTTKFSAQAKDLLQKLLNKDPARRMTLQEMQAHPWMTGASLMNNSIIRRASSAISDQLMVRKAELPPAQGKDEVRPSPREESPADRMSGSGSADKKMSLSVKKEEKREGDETTERIEPKKEKERESHNNSSNSHMELQSVDEGQPDPTTHKETPAALEAIKDMSVDSLAMERVTQPRRASRSLVSITMTAGACA